MKKILFVATSLFVLNSCTEKKNDPIVEGKVKRDVIAFAPKVTGRILEIRVEEGDQVHVGDTLAVLDVPEAKAKLSQVQGLLKSAEAQKTLAQNGATPNQLKQLRAKKAGLQEQFNFAEKSFNRAKAMAADSMMSAQAFDEVLAKYMGAKAQLDAVNAELTEAENGIRYETKLAAQGQADQAKGALQEVQIALSERYIIATSDMMIETISLHEGELATAGYPIFNGYIPNKVYFRFTLPEKAIAAYQTGQEVEIEMPFLKQNVKGKISTIKQLTRYANITAAYPDYQIEEAIYEIKVVPVDLSHAGKWLTNATAVLK
ncbi:HlyD family secretion protein [Leadbetterella byssophila]|uniref:HlyD family secretion protein n=1 Tax=Leadbetterella byssophila TaxID=316068 RepID=UPI0039A1DED3